MISEDGLKYHVERFRSLQKAFKSFSTSVWYCADTSTTEAGDPDRANASNVIIQSGCHGKMKYCNLNTDVIISSLQPYDDFNIVGDSDCKAFATTYWSEIMPYFNRVLIKPYEVGDKEIFLDPNHPGNYVVMAAIFSRQPWESPKFISLYKKLRETLTPLFAVLGCMYGVRSPHLRSGFNVDCDAFSHRANPNLIVDFSKTGNLNYYSDLLKGRSKEGIFAAFNNKPPLDLVPQKIIDELKKVTSSGSGKELGSLGRVHVVGNKIDITAKDILSFYIPALQDSGIKEEDYLCAD
jgi:hypothetical protein